MGMQWVNGENNKMVKDVIQMEFNGIDFFFRKFWTAEVIFVARSNSLDKIADHNHNTSLNFRQRYFSFNKKMAIPEFKRKKNAVFAEEVNPHGKWEQCREKMKMKSENENDSSNRRAQCESISAWERGPIKKKCRERFSFQQVRNIF